MVNEDKNIKINIDGIPETTKEELLNPPAKLIGQAISGGLYYLLNPLLKHNIIKKHELELFSEEVQKKTSNVPEEKRDDSKLGLALKALEDSKYQLNSKELREMFASLIASSINKDINDSVEPSFSSILKDLSHEDALLLKKFFIEPHIPAVSIQFEDTNTNVYFTNYKHILLFKSASLRKEISISSLERLGLIEFSTRSLSSTENKRRYSNFESSTFYKILTKDLPVISNENFSANKVNLIKEHASLTPLGERFCAVVLS